MEQKSITLLSTPDIKNLEFSVVDVETTGLNARRDRITEIAIVHINALKVASNFTTLVNPLCSIPEVVQRLTGITDPMVADAPRFSELGEHILAQLQGRIVIAHNARFDLAFLAAELSRVNLHLPPLSFIDTIKQARKIIPGLSSYKLQSLCRYFDIVPGRHRALSDASATAELFLRLVDRQEREREKYLPNVDLAQTSVKMS